MNEKDYRKFETLEKKLNIFFDNKDLLVQAFCHRSYLNEHPEFTLNHNERLEFLGDAVIELVVSEFLFENYPDKREGLLTSWRAALVNSRSLSELAEELGFGSYLLLSKGEKKEAQKKEKSYYEILANTFEAFIGALYLDKGYSACQRFLKKHLLKKLPDIIKNNLYKDSKSKLQEIAQEKEVELIIVGQSLDEDGKATFSGRKSARLARALRKQAGIPVELWDEFRSTQIARENRLRRLLS